MKGMRLLVGNRCIIANMIALSLNFELKFVGDLTMIVISLEINTVSYSNAQYRHDI